MSEAEPATGSLLLKTAQGTGWMIGWRMATRLLGVVSTLTLVRLLLPTDFGLVALSTSFQQSIEAFLILGVEEAVVREKAPTRDIYDTGFTVNALRSVATAAIILIFAVPAGRFFAEPRLANILIALAAGTLLEGLTNIGIVDFRRDFTFSKEFQLWLLPRLIGIVLTLACAFMWRSYWALVVGILVSRTLRMVFSYYMHPYRPRITVRAWRHLIGYSSWSWALNVVGLMRDRSDSILIGRMLDPTQVGIYSLGAEVAALPTTELIEPFCRVAFSGFAAARNSDLTPGETYLRLIGIMSLLTLPTAIGIALVADPLVNLAFGPLWTGAVPLVQLLALAGVPMLFGQVSIALFAAHALLPQIFAVGLGSVLLRVTLLIAFISQSGLYGAAIAAAISICLEQSLYVLMAMRRIAVNFPDFLRATWRCLLATAAMAAALLRLGVERHIPSASSGALTRQLMTAILAGAASYTVVLIAAWLAAGRPAGAETDLLALARGTIVRLGGTFWAR